MNNKTVLPLFALLVLTSLPAQAKQINFSEVPTSVINRLKSLHPDAENVTIDKELHFRMNLYEVKFKAGDRQTAMLFDTKGRPFGHQEKIDPQQLPAAVSKKLERTFAGYSIRNTQLITHPDGRVEYELAIKADSSDWELAMNPNGNILAKTLAAM